MDMVGVPFSGCGNSTLTSHAREDVWFLGIVSSNVPTPQEPAGVPFDTTVFDDDPSTIYALDASLRITYVNRAWARFGKENGAPPGHERWGVGSRLLDVIPAIVAPLYERLFFVAMTRRRVVEHDYLCSTPEALRVFRMRILPYRPGSVVVVHSPMRESSQTLGGPPLSSLYRSAEGFITMCSHCRRVALAEDPSAWEWVPELVEHPSPRTTFGLCAICAAFFYEEVEAAERG
jgi:hypothetical protein